jgi:hypothetical protein
MSYNTPIATLADYGVVKLGNTNSKDLGYFYSTLTQLNLQNINLVTLSNTTVSQGITLQNNSQLVVTKPAYYYLAVMMQFSKTSGGSAAKINFWLRRNGINVPDSTTDMTISNNNSNAVASWTYLLYLNANDYLEMVWNSPSSESILPAVAAQTNIPATPSARMSLIEM